MLLPGDTFPETKLSLVGGGEIAIPSEVAGSWVYLLFYRGGW